MCQELLFVWGLDRTIGSYPLTTDLRARKSTGVIMTFLAIYPFDSRMCVLVINYATAGRPPPSLLLLGSA